MRLGVPGGNHGHAIGARVAGFDAGGAVAGRDEVGVRIDAGLSGHCAFPCEGGKADLGEVKKERNENEERRVAL